MLPNFLIVGAAKSGTTSLYRYLQQHPDIFMSQKKEPKFFSSQFLKFPFVGPGDQNMELSICKTFDKYESLFKYADNIKAVGEASADNLYYYTHAIPLIKKYLGNVKILIILRNPIDRAFSSYNHLVRDNREELSFEEAFEKSSERKNNNWEFIWHYKDVGFYFRQVEAYLNNFKSIKIVLYEDLRDDAPTLIKDLYRFLEVDPSFEPDVTRKYNFSGNPKNKLLHSFWVRGNLVKTLTKSALRIFIEEEKLDAFRDRMFAANLMKNQMNPSTRNYLRELYREDILKLQTIIKRDLSKWLA